jgi:hypothetical protein
MTRKDTPAESIRGYLQQLTPQTRGRLLAEVERLRLSGDDVPGADIILAALRTEFHREGQSTERLDPAARYFFRALEPFVVDRFPERTHGGQISRTSLSVIWDWIGRDLMASMARDYLAELKRLMASGKQREAEQAVQTFQTKAVKYLEGTLASGHGAEQARARLAAHAGSPATFDDLTKMLCALKAREALAKFAQALPARIDKLVGERLDKTRTALDAFAADHGDAVPFALTLVAKHLVAPWQLVRLATKAADTKSTKEIAATPYSVAVTMVLNMLDDKVDALGIDLANEHVARAKETLVEIYDMEYAVRVRINLSDESAWGRRLDAIMARLSEVLDSEMHNLPAGLHHVLGAAGLKRHESVLGQLTRLTWKLRDVVAGSATYGRHMLAAVRNSHAWSIFH